MKPVLASLFLSCIMLCCGNSYAQTNAADVTKEMLCSGKWSLLVNEQGGKLLALAEEDQNAYIRFKADGTVISGSGSQKEEDGQQGEWKLVNNKIIITLSDDTRIYRFAIKSKNKKQYLYATFDIGDGPVTRVMVRNDSK